MLTQRPRPQYASYLVPPAKPLSKSLNPGSSAWLSLATIVLLLINSSNSLSQSTATYHLHQETSATGGLFQLKTAAPDTASVAVQSADLKNQPTGEYLIKAFDTAAGVPNMSGTIAASSTVSFTLWMKKTANFGTMVPRAKVYLNSSSGPLLCTATGGSTLSHGSVDSYALNCTTGAAISMSSSDRIYLWVGVNMTAGPGNKTVRAELDVEGTLNGNYDSRVVVPLPNVAPTVSITAPANNASFLAGANVAIDATAADSDGTVSKVEFFQGSTKLGEDSTSPYSYAWNNVSTGSYSLTAKATDNASAATTSSAVNISVTPPNSPPAVNITSPSNNAAFTAPATIDLQVTASDSDGSVAKVEFFEGTNKLGEDTSSPYSFAWTNVATGNYSLTAKATDNLGTFTTSSAINVTVDSPANAPPAVNLTNPANNATFVAPASVQLDATASDSDGSVTKVEFFDGSTLLGEDTNSPYSFTWNNVAVGNYALTAKATDNGGATTTSSAVNIAVTTSGGSGQLIAHYKLDEPSGPTAFDSSGNNHHATLQGGPLPAWTPGKMTGALSFNGVNQWVDTGVSIVDTTGDYSVSAWVLLSSDNGWAEVVSQDATNVSGFFLQYDPLGYGNRFKFTVMNSDSTSGGGSEAFASFSPTLNTWYHLTAVHDSVNDRIQLYVNGTLQDSQPFSSAWSAPGRTVIGRAKWNGNPSTYWPGKIDDVRIYARALPSQEIQTLFQTGVTSLITKEYIYAGGRLLATEEAPVTQIAPPLPPSSLGAAAISSNQILLTWTDNAGNEDGFKIEQSLAGGNFTQIAAVGINVTSFSVINLLPSTSYSYRVRGYNAIGNSKYSNIGAAVTGAPAVTGTGLRGEYYANLNLTNLKVTRTDATVDFVWGWNQPDPSVPADFSARWTGRVQPLYSETYTFYANADNGARLWVNGVPLVDRWTDQPAENSGTIALTAGQHYDIRFEFYDASFDGRAQLSWSSPSQPKQIIPASQLFSGGNIPPEAPGNLLATTVSANQVNLSWLDVAANESGYKIERSVGGGNFEEIALVGPNLSTYSATGLTALTSYSFRVRAYNGFGSSVSPAITVVPGATGTGLKAEYYGSQTLTDLRVTRIDPSLDLDWGWGSPDPTVPPDNFSARWTGQVQPRYSETYTFSTDTDEGLRLWVNGQLLIDRWGQIGGGVNSGTIPLTAGQKYDLRMEFWEGGIVARAKLYWSSTNQAYEIVPQSQLYPPENSLLPDAPLNLSVRTVSSSQIDLTWQDSANNETGFKIQRSTDGGTNFEEIATLPSNATSFTVSGLAASTVCIFRVFAYNLSGNSASISRSAASNGAGAGLKGEYFDNKDLTNLKLTRTDTVVSFDWGWAAPDPSLEPDTFSVRWSGQVEPRYSETYTFYTYTGDGVRLWVNGILLIDKWIYQEAEHSATIALVAGQKYDIRFEYYDESIIARAYLSWSSTSQSKEIIPQSQLYPVGGGAGCLATLPPPSTLPPDTIWFDDTLPAGAVPYGAWGWDPEQKVSGTVSHRGLPYPGLYHFENATQTLSVSSSENLVTYVLVSPCKPPKEIVLQWRDSSGSWEHRAFWGQDLLAWGTLGTASRYAMGPIPAVGQWVRLEVPAAFVGMGGRTANGMSFTLYDGEAWFDRAGKAPGTCVTAQTPASLPNDTVWFDDQLPAGSVTTGTWVWDTTQKASGTQSNTEPSAIGLHQHYFENASQTLTINSGDKLFAYVLVNPCDPPKEVMLQWRDAANGSWEHRAFWGADLINAGTPGTASRYSMGPLPQSNVWVRLEVPASAVGLEGKTINGIAFTLYDGQAWFDRAGKSP